MSPTATDAWACELRGFAKSYHSGWATAPVAAVQGLSLQLAPGQVLGLLGPNGSGKSTTLKALAGLLAPTAGECRVFGHAAGSDAARARVGYLPETPRFAPHQTGREFLHYCAGLSSLPAAAVARRVDEVLAWSGLREAADRRLATYSKGLAQRLGLAQAILHDPGLVLLDEPASGLDPEGRLALGRLIRDLAARGKAVVFSSHLLAQAETLCDRLALLGRGRLLAEGTPAGLLGAGVTVAPTPSRLEQLYLEKMRS
ncbi:ABC transporter ATP-binding protein [Opitutus sp. GAS368]|jgi:ABC-type multidrug transport system ATPase subunit|uniref:ABC transporter ATP-binding protein n=1 Tax=Opitutus sp. GAS368 TaxID=1882749 RepID=UPI00087BEFAE|nr:ABC transporter ATP-binding protein [Opitutus sp. GAS368]SDS64820.1 ABC-2 type transport system ATP-binding protein [Opitutus sp. GAS368]